MFILILTVAGPLLCTRLSLIAHKSVVCMVGLGIGIAGGIRTVRNSLPALQLSYPQIGQCQKSGADITLFLKTEANDPTPAACI